MAKRSILIFSALFLFAASVDAQIFTHGFYPNKVALSFDDGPSGKYTEQVLDILKRYHIKATFFVVGIKAEKEPELLKRIADEGHDIGNHTFFHSKLSWINDKKLISEIKMTSDFIIKTTGTADFLFRPPHGTLPYSKIKLIEDAGYNIVLWSVNADDFYKTGFGMRSPTSIANRVLSRIHGSDIILMHDDSEQTVESLPIIIWALKKRGYAFVPVSKLIVPGARSLSLEKPLRDPRPPAFLFRLGL